MTPSELPPGTEILTLYLDIERTRFQDRLVINYDVQPATLDAMVPDLILQALVENAIRHGWAPTPGVGRIDVRSRAEGEWLILEIHDNGAGIPAGESPREGIGVSTTKERLQHLYGARHELELGMRRVVGSGHASAFLRLAVVRATCVRDCRAARQSGPAGGNSR
jgi:LytS/YehU family sensor histidine kinase